MKKQIILYVSYLALLFALTGYSTTPAIDNGNVIFTFINTVKGIPIVINDSTYTNPFGETYSIRNLKYYISNIHLLGTVKAVHKKENFQLVDETNKSATSFSLAIKPGTYTTINFTIGVDSLYNVSGAQGGALDPMNGMFWTWNSGYIMAKFEGTSPASKQVNNRFEYHIGGFSGPNNTVKKIALTLTKPLVILTGEPVEIIIAADLDKWWQSSNDIKIAETPVCTTPGELAKKIAGNYSKMFSIKTVINKY